ncbi:MAG: NAD(P)H-hydrate dehydratase [Ruminococcaceae bacterium]|nr:NAD(P)H-hydrate dehydratase [Oscillospiraceae bacterium]
MKVCFAEEMRNADKTAIEEYGIPGIVLMENAGAACARAMECFEKITIVCGKGNNAGDGLCIARHLVSCGKDVKVYLAMGREFAGDALVNYNILTNMRVEMYSCQSPDFEIDLERSDCVCDAIFGTGIKGEVPEFLVDVIEKINRLSRYILSVDMPSGVNADTGEVANAAVKADKTITFAAYKMGLLLFPGCDYAGSIEVADITIPHDALSLVKAETVDENEVLRLLPKRQRNSHKGDYGKVFVIGGSMGMAGAVTLAARAVFKSGAGLCTVCVPKELNDIIQSSVVEATVFPADFEKEQDKIIEKIKDFDVVLFGNGIGREDYVKELLFKVMENVTCPLIIDADGLFALKENPDMLRNCRSEVMLTPHTMEFSRILGGSVAEVEKNRCRLSAEFAKEYFVTLVLKGNHTIITAPDGAMYFNLTGNSGMATAGSGDVLAGMAAGLAHRCKSLTDAAKLAVYLHGKAGDKAASIFGENGMTASDIVDAIPHIFPVEKDERL